MISELVPYLTNIYSLHSLKIHKNRHGKNRNESFLAMPETHGTYDGPPNQRPL